MPSKQTDPSAPNLLDRYNPSKPLQSFPRSSEDRLLLPSVEVVVEVDVIKVP